MDYKDLVPSEAERIGTAMKRIVESPDWKISFGRYIERELKVCETDIAQAETIEKVWKGVGKLQSFREMERAIEVMVALADKKREVREAKIEKQTKRKDK